MRKKKYNQFSIKPDCRYNSYLVSQFINIVMVSGKKLLAQRIVYGVLKNIEVKLNGSPVHILHQAINNSRPKIEIKSKRVGGATYQIPTEITYKRQTSLALKWLTLYARKKKGSDIITCLTSEVIDAYNNMGLVIKRKEEIHKAAHSNKMFSYLK
jgi:small subunit ribosomal protein S7